MQHASFPVTLAASELVLESSQSYRKTAKKYFANRPLAKYFFALAQRL
jgi:hypothetical protein